MVEIRCYPGVMCTFLNVTDYHLIYHVYQSTHEFECELEHKLECESKFKLVGITRGLELWVPHLMTIQALQI